MILSILRILLYIQLLLGLFKYGERFGLPPLGHVFDVHELIGVIVAILAIYALRSLPGVQDTGIRTAARFFPLLPLVLGLSFVVVPTVLSTPRIVLLHMLLGIATIALVEMASGAVAPFAAPPPIVRRLEQARPGEPTGQKLVV